MRNILITLMLIFAFSAKALIVSNGSNSFDNTGAQLSKDKVHVSCKNGHSAAVSYGDVLFYSISADDGATCVAGGFGGVVGFGQGYPIAGVVDEGSCSVGAMCKIQVYGIHDAVKFDPAQLSGGSAVAGQSAVASAVAKYLTGGSTTASHSKVGIFLDDSSATGTIQVFIKSL